MDVAARLLHHPFYVVPTFANNVGVLRVRNIHLQRHSVALTRRRAGSWRDKGEIHHYTALGKQEWS